MSNYRDDTDEERNSALEERLYKAFKPDDSIAPRPSTLRRLHKEMPRRPSMLTALWSWLSRPVPVYKPIGISIAACTVCLLLLRIPSNDHRTTVYVQQPASSTIDTITKLVIDTIRLDLQRSMAGVSMRGGRTKVSQHARPGFNEYNGLRNLQYNARQSRGITVSDDSNVRRFIRSAPTEL